MQAAAQGALVKYITKDQRSEAWHLARLGIPTASRADAILTPAKLQLSAKRDTYIAELVSEWALGRGLVADAGTGGFMGRGTSLEDEAVAWLEWDKCIDVDPIGFCTLDDGSFGWSLDGRVRGERVTVETKCPGPKQHILNLLDPDGFVESHRGQVQAGLWGHGFEASWLVSYHPGLPKLARFVVRDDKYLAAWELALATFCAELREARAKLLALGCKPHVSVIAAREPEPVETF